MGEGTYAQRCCAASYVGLIALTGGLVAASVFRQPDPPLAAVDAARLSLVDHLLFPAIPWQTAGIFGAICALIAWVFPRRLSETAGPVTVWEPEPQKRRAPTSTEDHWPAPLHPGLREPTSESRSDELVRRELRRMLEDLRRSRAKIQEQNEQLLLLATRDPLTNCFNRRAIFERSEEFWSRARGSRTKLSCLMVDVDDFSSINRQHGRAVGDEVLKLVARSLLTTVPTGAFVGRYSGEQYCVLLPECDLSQALWIAEQVFEAIDRLELATVRVEVSIGVSSTELGAGCVQDLLDEADRSLSEAQRQGRSRLASWDVIRHKVATQVQRSPNYSNLHPSYDNHASRISYHAVASLLSALAYRDPDTAAHATRVADLCVVTARGRMSLSELYILETAALLHDIGKIGVPDAILLKPSRLNEEEWRIMHLHSRIGSEIIAASFNCPDLVEMVRHHHAHFASDDDSGQPQGTDIPIGSRIISIADAYDAMISDRVYRRGCSQSEAFAELRRHAGRQFDPVLVEQFIERVTSRNEDEVRSGPMSKEVAVNLGVHIEQLARAVDDRDLASVEAFASRLEATATKYEVPEVAAIARRLRAGDRDDLDLAEVIATAHELIDLCAMAQKAHISVHPDVSTIDQVRRAAAAFGSTG